MFNLLNEAMEEITVEAFLFKDDRDTPSAQA